MTLLRLQYNVMEVLLETGITQTTAQKWSSLILELVHIAMALYLQPDQGFYRLLKETG